MRIRWRLIFSVGLAALGLGILFTVFEQYLPPWSARWSYGFLSHFGEALIISIVTLLIVRWNIRAPISRAVEWIRNLRQGIFEDVPLIRDIFEPVAKEVTGMAKSLSAARAAAQTEAQLRQTGESLWTPERLKEHMRTKLQNRPLFVISNREPYRHMRSGNGKQVECEVPASGLVTALEPILDACGGTWIAHGDGNADRDVVDAGDKIRVPPDEPQYLLRRVWLSQEEVNGYYYSFANEGLWPLCHIAHTRPLFRPEDWAYYQAVNQKFADAALEEMQDTQEPCVLVQDYHFALLPRLIKEKRPDARIALFWHIPWPNPESFGICPWQRELLQGMLGADLLGFHIQYHCNNFLDTVDRTLESLIDWERYAVHRQEHTTWVKPFPISISFTQWPLLKPKPAAPRLYKAGTLKNLGINAHYLGVGVDRIDYTKGILERFRAVERFLEKYPAYQGQFTYVELGAPSRTLIKRYGDLVSEVETEAKRINERFKAPDWKAIVLLKKQHSHKEIDPYYKAADVCLVTSLHDGMNLVAKEFVAAREDEDGVLILSHFTGASRELRDAVLINPYDIDQMAEAIRLALEMDEQERKKRMKNMREDVREHNIYRWAANLVTELTQIRRAEPPREIPAEAVIPAEAAHH